MNKYQFKTKTPSGLGNTYYYCYADDRFETYLNIKNIKYKKNWKNKGKNEFEELKQELQRKDNIINELKKWGCSQLYCDSKETNNGYYVKAIRDMFDKIKELENEKDNI